MFGVFGIVWGRWDRFSIGVGRCFGCWLEKRGLEDSEDIEIFEVFFVRYFFGDGVT